MLEHLTVQDLFHNIFFFTINKFWRRWHNLMSSSDRVWWGRSQLNNVEDWMEASHEVRECQAVGIVSDAAFNWVWSEAMVRQLS